MYFVMQHNFTYFKKVIKYFLASFEITFLQYRSTLYVQATNIKTLRFQANYTKQILSSFYTHKSEGNDNEGRLANLLI